jgi:hypothetical protein
MLYNRLWDLMENKVLNPAIGSNCQNLLVGYAICVGISL